MSGLDRVMVPLDGSPRAEVALSWLHLLPARQVRLVQVCDDVEIDEASAAQYLADVSSRLGPPGSSIETRVLRGSAAEAIVADARDSDLIVMSTQGAGGGGRLFFGSVADRVMRHAPAPTLLLRGGSVPVATATLQRVVVPLDGSSAAERALPVASLFARLVNASVHLVTVDDSADEEHGPIAGLRNDDPGYLDTQATSLESSGIVATRERVSGDPATELRRLVGPGDLLVLTTHGSGAARRWQIGRVAEKLLRQATAPVVLVRADSD
jgi:nucleotide-binding universal stress UspA family protein